MRILILKPSSLGDVIQALPVATGLKRHWPDARIDWFVFDAYRDLIQDHPSLNRVWSLPKPRWNRLSLWRAYRAMTREWRKESYDMVIDLQGLFRSGLLAWMSGAKRRIGLASAREGSHLAYTEVVADDSLSSLDRYLSCLHHLGVPSLPADFQLDAPLPTGLIPPGPPYTVLHPYSRWKTKLWPWRNLQELLRLLPDRRFVIIGEGPWFPLFGSDIIDLRGQLNLRQLKSVLAHAEALVSTDSGPAHLGAALGVRTIALFGATDWRRTGPVGPKVNIEFRPLFCTPCLKRSCHNPRRLECMSEIRPEEIVNVLQKFY